MEQKLFTTKQSAFLAGIRDFAPIILGVIPFGLVYGVTAINSGISPLEGILMSIFMVAGAAQIVTIELLNTDAATWIIILSATMVNLRFIIYSASLTPYFKPYSIWWRIGLGYFITDQPYALSVAYFTENPDTPHKQWYHLGHSLTLWVWWIISSALGLFVGDFIPEAWAFGFAIPLMFIGIAVPAIKDWTFVVAAIVAAIVALIAVPLPNNLGLIVAVACGMAVGVLLGESESA